MAADVHRLFMSVEEYLEFDRNSLDARYEYIDGQEYVLISTQEQVVDVYRRASDNLWTLHPFGPGDEIELKSINVSIPLEALYENVTVPRDNA